MEVLYENKTFYDYHTITYYTYLYNITGSLKYNLYG